MVVSTGFWNVPKAMLGAYEVPRLALGDHGFHSQYGRTLTEDQSVTLLGNTLSQASVGVAAGEDRCLRAAREVGRRLHQDVFLICHTDVPLTVAGQAADFGRCMASLLTALREQLPVCAAKDPIVGTFLHDFREYPHYLPAEIAAFEVPDQYWDQECARITAFRPKLLTVGGDYLDCILVGGRVELAVEVLRKYRQMCDRLMIPLVFTSYVAPFCWSKVGTERLIAPCDAVMVPINSAGAGMLPNRRELLSWLGNVGRPAIAMHPLGSGRIDVLRALNYVLNEVGVAAAIAGASTLEHITHLLQCARSVLTV